MFSPMSHITRAPACWAANKAVIKHPECQMQLFSGEVPTLHSCMWRLFDKMCVSPALLSHSSPQNISTWASSWLSSWSCRWFASFCSSRSNSSKGEARLVSEIYYTIHYITYTLYYITLITTVFIKGTVHPKVKNTYFRHYFYFYLVHYFSLTISHVYMFLFS